MAQPEKTIVFSIPSHIQKIIIYSEVHCLTTLYPILFSLNEEDKPTHGKKTHMAVMPGLSITCLCLAKQCRDQSTEFTVRFANAVIVPSTVEKHQLGLLLFEGNVPTFKQLTIASVAVRLYTQQQLNKMLRNLGICLPKEITEFMYASQYQRKLAVANANHVNHVACTNNYCVLTGHQSMAHSWDLFAENYEKEFFPANKIKFPTEEIKSPQYVMEKPRLKKRNFTLLAQFKVL